MLGADVAFFERFHGELLATALHLLRPAADLVGDPVSRRVAAACAREAGEAGDAAAPLGVVLSDAVLAAAVTAPGALVILAPSRGGSLERLATAAAAAGEAVPGGLDILRLEGVGECFSETCLGGRPLEGAADGAAGPMQLLVIQRLSER